MDRRTGPVQVYGRIPEHAMRCGVGEVLAHEMHAVQADCRLLRRAWDGARGEKHRLQTENDAMREQVQRLEAEVARLGEIVTEYREAADASEAVRRGRKDDLLETMTRGSAALKGASAGAAAWAARGREVVREAAEAAEAARVAREEEAEEARQALATAEAQRVAAEAAAEGAAAVAQARNEERKRAAATAAAERLAIFGQLEAERAEAERAALETAMAQRAAREELIAERLAVERQAVEERKSFEAEAAKCRADLLAEHVAREEAAAMKLAEEAAKRAALEDFLAGSQRDLAGAQQEAASQRDAAARAEAAGGEAAAAAAAEAAEEAAFRAFTDAWRAAPANRRGKLRLTVHSAHDLRRSDYRLLGGSSDPFVVVQFGEGAQKRTSTQPKSRSPEWEEVIALGGVTAAHLQYATLVLTVLDEDNGRLRELFSTRDDHMGQATVGLAALIQAPHNHSYEIDLGGGAVSGCGTLKVSAAFVPLPPDDAALHAAYEATGRRVPSSARANEPGRVRRTETVSMF